MHAHGVALNHTRTVVTCQFSELLLLASAGGERQQLESAHRDDD
jgi:hypothetical protein